MTWSWLPARRKFLGVSREIFGFRPSSIKRNEAVAVAVHLLLILRLIISHLFSHKHEVTLLCHVVPFVDTGPDGTAESILVERTQEAVTTPGPLPSLLGLWELHYDLWSQG